MAELWEALPVNRRGGYAATAEVLEAEVANALRAGDAVMVKGSLGSRMGPIAKSLVRRFSPRGARADIPAQG
jgi:UDP-N-acetylmuramoyl-tripeptide--D-alanyl-D-alanine ligase